MDHYAETDRLLRREFGLGATRYDGPALLELEPALKRRQRRRMALHDRRQLHPEKLMRAWRQVFHAQGVECASIANCANWSSSAVWRGGS
jgi:D-amino-acid dehydrogenase